MRIIIVGATIVGTDLAEYLVQAGHAVTLIDNPSEELAQIANRLDLRVVQGDPTWPSVLREAGARNTELLVATSPNDEVNIAVCSVASALFNIPRKIARMRAPDFLSEADKLFGEQAIPIDHVISPEHLMADAVVELMNFPGAIAVNNFANDRLTVAGVTCSAGGKLIGAQILDLENYDGKCKVLAVFRNGKPLTKLENQTLILGDDVFFCAERLRALNLLSALIPLRPNGKNVVIQGGSHIADAIALRLSQRYKVKLIEPDAKRAARISDRFRNSAVKLFQTDTFIAASPQEESNIMASLMVQRVNKVRTIAIIRQHSFQDIAIAGNEIDAIISPREAIISALLSHILQEGVLKMRIFRQGQSEALELLVQGEKRSSHVVGRKIDDLKMDENYVFTDGDHIVAFLNDRKHMRTLVKLFKPRPFWLPRWS